MASKSSATRVVQTTSNEVAAQANWAEHCRREARSNVLNQNFALNNLRTVADFADKPNRLQPQSLRVDMRLDDSAVLQALKDLQRVSSTNIRAQLLGEARTAGKAINTTLLHLPHPMFDRRRHGCDVTAYADAYCASTKGESPFAKSGTMSSKAVPLKK